MIGLAFAASCSSYDDSEIRSDITDLKSRVSLLEERISQINNNLDTYIKTLRALEDGDRILSVSPFEDETGSGYLIKFSKTGDLKVYNGSNGTNGLPGNDGHTPVIGVKQEDPDEAYYWTVDGEYLLDGNQQKIAATSHIAAPQVQVSADGKHYEISFDNGKTWLTVGDVAETGGSKTIFDKVEDGDEAVTFYLTEGGTIVIPKIKTFSLNITKVNYIASAGETLSINYTVTEADDATIVNGFGTNGYLVSFEAMNTSIGTISVTIPSPMVEGQVFVFAIKGDGTTSGRILSFAEGIITVNDMFVPASVPAEGGSVMLMISTNQDYTVEIQEEAIEWITIVDTKAAVRDEMVVLNIAANTGNGRSAYVKIRDERNEVVKTITIVQEGASGGNTSSGYTNPIADWERNETLTF